MAKQGFRANLYGAGGDEVFAGYSSDYFLPYLRYLLKQGRSIRCLKEFFQFSEESPGPLGLNRFQQAGKLLLPRAARFLPWAPRIYHNLVKDEIHPGGDPFLIPSGVSAHAGPANDLDGRMRDNMTNWLMNYWLRIDNQNSMGIPLELRMPFLDHRVVEFGYTVPMELLIRNGWMKWLLRYSMEDLLPRDVIWRKQKMGFPFPLRQWLGRFKDRILSMIQPLDSPYLDMKTFKTGYDTMREHDPAYLWCLISLAMWWKRCVQNDRLA